MVSKKVLEKLSDRELENYIKPDSRFVSVAIGYAYEILQSRGRTFDEDEKLRIERMIIEKKDLEITQLKPFASEFDEHITEDENAVELYTKRVIWIFSILFGVVFGAVLQAMNFARLKNKKALFLSLLYGTLYTIIQIFALKWIEDSGYELSKYNNAKSFIFSTIGAMILQVIREQYMPQNLPYRSRAFVAPLVVAILIYIPIVYLMIMGR